MKPLVLTPGDPAGIGFEVTAASLGALHRPVVVVGDATAFERAATPLGLSWTRTDTWPTGLRGVALLDPGDDSEPVEIASIRMAVGACLDGRAAGLVTGPIHKAKLAHRGFSHPGHTDFLGELCGIERPVMAFVGGQVRVALVTVHLPLREVANAITSERVRHTVEVADYALRVQLGLRAPRLAVCGLNPHAGDSGLLGREEGDVIAPAVDAARAAGIDARGPISAETAFRLAVTGGTDLVVAMYHDQGLAPLKALDFGRSVNWTIGLPIVRTSVDHGTAYDIAWTGAADPSSMRAALHLANTLC